MKCTFLIKITTAKRNFIQINTEIIKILTNFFSVNLLSTKADRILKKPTLCIFLIPNYTFKIRLTDECPYYSKD